MLVDEAAYEESVAYLTQGGEIVCDTETTGVDWRGKDRVCGVCLLARERSFYFPFRHKEGPNLPESLLPDLVQRVLPPHRHHVGYHYNFDIQMLHKEGMQRPEEIDDSMLGAHVLNENEPSFKMENVCTRYIDPDAYKHEAVLVDKIHSRFGGAKSKAKSNLWRMPATDVWEYGEQDVWSTRSLRDWQKPHLKEWRLKQVYRGVCEYQLIIGASQRRGMLLDIPLIHKLMAEADVNANDLESQIQIAAGYEANPRSSKQMQALLGLKSTAKDILEAVGDRNPLAAKLLEYRIWSKATGTYYRPFLQCMSPDNVLRANINCIGTISGRPTCTKPNLLSIPRDVDKYPIKRVFVAREGFLYLEADFSQAEMRIATHYAQDVRMRELLLAGEDLHGAVAKEQGMPRDIAKRLNFSVIYGIGPRKFSQTYKIPYPKACEYLNKYHAMFPGFRRLYNGADQKAQDRGYIRHFTGRIRRFNDHRRAPSHKASSNLVQGAVAEMIRLAIIRLSKECPWAHQLLSVYDSILFEIPYDSAISDINLIRSIMEDQDWCSIPMKVDMKVGPRWGQMEEVSR